MHYSNSAAIIQVSEFEVPSLPATRPPETQNQEVSPCRQTTRSMDDIAVATFGSGLAYSTRRLLAINRIVNENL